MAKHSSRGVPVGDHPTRHPLSHHSDHSGAHVRATHHHEAHAHTTDDGHEPPMRGRPSAKGPNNPFVEGSPAEEASESPQEEGAEQDADIGGANPDEAMG
jgi:hypothetical protein